MTRSGWAATVAAIVLAASLVWGWQILSSEAQARTAGGVEQCGSVLHVLVTGDAYRGGELRPDQAAHDGACVSDARDHVRVAAVPASVTLVSVLILLPSLRVGHRRARSDREHRLAPHRPGDSVDE